jgi:pimeloyl-ACP methyl ester carboxylesterase
VVLDCDDDPLIPAVARDRLRNQYPRARHARLATGGHYPHVLNPQRYEGLLLDVAFA